MATFALSVLKLNSLECGECRACCVQFPLVPEAEFWPEGKPVGQACKFLGENGCSIHDQPRPKVCGDFICEWRAGIFGTTAADWRPDRCGLILHQAGLDVLLQGDLASMQEQRFVPAHWQPEDLSLGIVETRPKALLETERFRIQYRLEKARLRPRSIVVTPYGFDVIASSRTRGMRFSRGRSIAVWADDNQDHRAYADAVCEWWEGAAARVAA